MIKAKRVLLVDDDPLSQVLNRSMLRSYGFKGEIESIHTGSEALTLLNSRSDQPTLPDLLVLYLKAPHMDSVAFVRKYFGSGLGEKHQVQIIILSSSTNQQMVDFVKAHGVIVISKPTRSKTGVSYN